MQRLGKKLGFAIAFDREEGTYHLTIDLTVAKLEEDV
jgi:hypothetical protein